MLECVCVCVHEREREREGAREDINSIALAFFFETTVSQRFFSSLSLHQANRTIMTPFKAWTIAQPMDESRWRKKKPFQKLFFKKNKKRLRKLQMWTSMQWNTFCILCSEQKERKNLLTKMCNPFSLAALSSKYHLFFTPFSDSSDCETILIGMTEYFL